MNPRNINSTSNLQEALLSSAHIIDVDEVNEEIITPQQLPLPTKTKALTHPDVFVKAERDLSLCIAIINRNIQKRKFARMSYHAAMYAVVAYSIEMMIRGAMQYDSTVSDFNSTTNDVLRNGTQYSYSHETIRDGNHTHTQIIPANSNCGSLLDIQDYYLNSTRQYYIGYLPTSPYEPGAEGSCSRLLGSINKFEVFSECVKALELVCSLPAIKGYYFPLLLLLGMLAPVVLSILELKKKYIKIAINEQSCFNISTEEMSTLIKYDKEYNVNILDGNPSNLQMLRAFKHRLEQFKTINLYFWQLTDQNRFMINEHIRRYGIPTTYTPEDAINLVAYVVDNEKVKYPQRQLLAESCPDLLPDLRHTIAEYADFDHSWFARQSKMGFLSMSRHRQTFFNKLERNQPEIVYVNSKSEIVKGGHKRTQIFPLDVENKKKVVNTIFQFAGFTKKVDQKKPKPTSSADTKENEKPVASSGLRRMLRRHGHSAT